MSYQSDNFKEFYRMSFLSNCHLSEIDPKSRKLKNSNAYFDHMTLFRILNNHTSFCMSVIVHIVLRMVDPILDIPTFNSESVRQAPELCWRLNDASVL